VIRMIVYWLILTGAVFLTFKIVPGLTAKKNGTYFVVAAVYGILNSLIWFFFGPLLKPLSVLTLGLVGWIVNAVILLITDKVLEDFKSESAVAVMAGALCIIFFSWLFQSILL